MFVLHMPFFLLFSETNTTWGETNGSATQRQPPNTEEDQTTLKIVLGVTGGAAAITSAAVGYIIYRERKQRQRRIDRILTKTKTEEQTVNTSVANGI